MTLPWTLGWLCIATLLAASGAWLERRSRARLVVPPFPPLFLLGLGIVGIVVGLGHLLTIFTGVELHGRGLN